MNAIAPSWMHRVCTRIPNIAVDAIYAARCDLLAEEAVRHARTQWRALDHASRAPTLLLATRCIAVATRGMAAPARTRALTESLVRLVTTASFEHIDMLGHLGVDLSDSLVVAIAARRGRDDLVRLLFKLGAPLHAIPNTPAKFARTPFVFAAMSDTGFPRTIRTLAELGADVNIRWEIEDKNVLMYTLHFSNNVSTDTVRALVEVGIDVNDRDENGLTALMYAARASPRVDIVRELLALGANPSARDTLGNTALEYARTQVFHTPEVVQLLEPITL